MKIKAFFTTSVLAALVAGASLAQDAALPDAAPTLRTTLYVASGSARADGPFENDDTPFAIGIMAQAPDNRLIFGADLGREGTFLDSTWRQNEAVKQGTSVNLLVGANLLDAGPWKAEAAALLGVRTASVDCADSYLGYQCYADTPPSTEYEANFGALVTVSYSRMTLGIRATGESTQIVAGLRF